MQPRVNIYGFPHKGLRHGLGQLSMALSKLDISDSSDI